MEASEHQDMRAALVEARERRAHNRAAQQEAGARLELPGLTLEEVSLLLRNRHERAFADGENSGYRQARAGISGELAQEARSSALLTLEVVVGELAPVLAAVVALGTAVEKAPRARTTGDQVRKAAEMAAALAPRLAQLVRDLQSEGLAP